LWDISIYGIGSINGVMLLVYDWLNLKFEKQWQGWTVVVNAVFFNGVLFIVCIEFVEQNGTEKYLLL
jgi:hypothetical protein